MVAESSPIDPGFVPYDDDNHPDSEGDFFYVIRKMDNPNPEDFYKFFFIAYWYDGDWAEPISETPFKDDEILFWAPIPEVDPGVAYRLAYRNWRDRERAQA